MKIGISGWVWTAPVTTAEVERLAPHIKRSGFDLLEIPLETIGDVDYARGASILANQGVAVSTYAVMGADRDLIHEDDAIRANGKRYLMQAIEATHALGATNLVGPLYSTVGRTWQASAIDRARDVDLLIATLRELALYASDKGVVLCVEPLNRYETSLVNLAAQANEIADRADRPNIGVALNTFHMNVEEKNIGDAIRKTGKRLKHFHACENDRGAPGSGHVPWNSVKQALKDIRYDGPVVIESFTPKIKSIARTAVWRDVEASPDALAEHGGKFLRQLFG